MGLDWIATKEKRRRYVRQIHLVRPGAEDIYLVTDLLDEKTYPAEDLLAVYLKRWEIERVFQKITDVFQLGHLIGSTPEATIFQASFCLVLYNLLEVMRRSWRPARRAWWRSRCRWRSSSMTWPELTSLVVLFPSATIAGWFAGEWSREDVVRLNPCWAARGKRYRKATNKKARPKAKKAKVRGLISRFRS